MQFQIQMVPLGFIAFLIGADSQQLNTFLGTFIPSQSWIFVSNSLLFPPKPDIPSSQNDNSKGQCHYQVEPPLGRNCYVHVVSVVRAELKKSRAEKRGNKSGREKDHGKPRNGLHARTVALRGAGNAEASQSVVGAYSTLDL